MSKKDLTAEDSATIAIALSNYSGEVGKLLKKAEKLGLDKAEQFKREFLRVEMIRDKFAKE